MNNSPAKVWNCPAAFELLCDRTWEGLAPTDRSHIRHCHSCNERVYLSTTPEEFVIHVKLGRCVSLPAAGIPPTDTSAQMLLGRVSPQYLQEIQALTARQWQQYHTWWQIVLDRDPFFIIPLIDKNFPDLLDFLIEINTNHPTERDLLELATDLITVLKIAAALVIEGKIRDAIGVYESFLVSSTELNDKQKNVILHKIAELRAPKVTDPTVEIISIARQAMTWSILNIIAIYGKVYALFGADAMTNPYRGDTDIQAVLPLLAIKKSGLPQPVGLPCTNTTNGGALRGSWSGGKVIIVPGIQGSSLISQAVADEKCRRQGLQLLGEDGFRMAEFHDGDNNAGWAGWDFWAEASALSVVKIGETRYWVYINDQPANPWCQTSPR
jgi:hypothetical protein